MLVLLVAAAVATPAFTRRADAVRCKMTPEGRVLVASDNVYEADKADAANKSDMVRFVARMKEKFAFAPDVVLLQEVRSLAVSNIKKELQKKFGCKFTIAVNASANSWGWITKYTKLGWQETAVIVNASSMLVRSKGFLTHDYLREEAGKGESIKVRKTAWANVLERDRPNETNTPLQVVAASVHYPRGSDFKNDVTNKRLKKEFSKQIADSLERTAPSGTPIDHVMHVIAGDFNNSRYEDGRPSNETPAYELLTHAPYNFIDGAIEHATGGAPNPIDFIFSNGKSYRGWTDSYNTHNEKHKNFYSNHDLRYILIGAY